MNVFYAGVFVVLAAVLISTAALSQVSWYQTWEMGRLARRVGLGVLADLDSLVRRRVASRLLWSSVGGLVGIALGLLAYLAFGRPPGIVVLYMVLFITVSGSSLGTIGAALRAESRTDDRPRVARSEAVDVRDFLVVLVPRLAWLIVALSAALLMLASVGGTSVHPIGVFLAGLGVVEMVVFEIVGRRIVSRGRPAASTDEMAWNDALTSATLRDLVSAPLQPVTLGGLYALIYATGLDGALAGIGVGLAILLFAVAIAYSFIFRSSPTWYLTQLWPGARRRTPEEESRRIAAAHAS